MTQPLNGTEDQPAAASAGTDAAGTTVQVPTHRAPRPFPEPRGAAAQPDLGEEEPTRADVHDESSATRPVPTSAEPPAPADEQPTVAVPVGAGQEPETAPLASAAPPAGAASQGPGAPPAPPTGPPGDATATGHGAMDLLPAPLPEEPPSRAAAHWWGVLIALTLTPVAWFLISDGSARIYWSLLNDPSDINRAGLIGLAGGLAVLAVVFLAARRSSVGPIIAGSLALTGGLAFLVVPVRALETVASWQETLERFGGFGSNVYLYLVESGLRGQLVVGGFVLVFVGVVSHGARRLGRKRERDLAAARAARGANPFS